MTRNVTPEQEAKTRSELREALVDYFFSLDDASSFAAWLLEQDKDPRRMEPMELLRDILVWRATLDPPQAFACDPDESCGYEADDPKHPDWHSVHADLYDQREGK